MHYPFSLSSELSIISRSQQWGMVGHARPIQSRNREERSLCLISICVKVCCRPNPPALAAQVGRATSPLPAGSCRSYIDLMMLTMLIYGSFIAVYPVQIDGALGGQFPAWLHSDGAIMITIPPHKCSREQAGLALRRCFWHCTVRKSRFAGDTAVYMYTYMHTYTFT